ncbi:MAG: hypothetical protein ACLFS9_06105 [Nitriliruptoraceae bacterium]
MSRELHVYAYVEAPFDLCAKLLAENAAQVFQQATDESADQARVLSRTLELEVGGFSVSRDVVIEVGEFEPRQLTACIVPLRWRAESGRLLFPELTAELEVAALVLDPPLTQLTLEGRYEPPLGALGAGADKLALGRLAEATVHRFIHEVADQLRRMVEAIPEDERLWPRSLG